MYSSIILAGVQSFLVLRHYDYLRILMLVALTIVVIPGSVMYLVESNETWFTSISGSIYWAIVDDHDSWLFSR